MDANEVIFIEAIARGFKREKKLIKKANLQKKTSAAMMDQLEDDIKMVASAIFKWHPGYPLNAFYRGCGWNGAFPIHNFIDEVEYVSEPA